MGNVFPSEDRSGSPREWVTFFLRYFRDHACVMFFPWNVGDQKRRKKILKKNFEKNFEKDFEKKMLNFFLEKNFKKKLEKKIEEN